MLPVAQISLGKGKTMSIANIIDVHMIKEALHDGGQGEVVTML